MTFKLRKRDTLPTNLATVVAAFGIESAIRHLLRKPDTRFVAAIAVPDASDLEVYQFAARQLLDVTNALDDAGMRTAFVDVASDFARPSTDLLSTFYHVRRAILFCTDETEISSDLGILIDCRVALKPPTARHFRAAAQQLGLQMTEAESDFLATKGLQQLRLAIRPGRSVARIVRQLQVATAPEDAAPRRRDRSDVRLEELAGYGEAKAWGLQLAKDIGAWKRGGIDWSDVDRGILLSGPPGSGKTTFARALANSCDVPLLHASAASWQARGHLGDMLKAMQKSFSEAFQRRPSILFLDEFDSFGDRGSGVDHQHHDYKRQVINGLLECLDPIDGREGVVIIGATNKPDAIDPALLRPGRIDKVVSIVLPDNESRMAILRYHLPDAVLGDLAEFVRKSEGWSGADIEKLAREARRIARAAGSKSVTEEDLNTALPPTVLFTEEERFRLAVHEIGHAIVGNELQPHALVKVSIDGERPAASGWRRIGATEFRSQSPALATAKFYSDHITIFLAGMAAERIVFGEHSAAAGGDPQADLCVATDFATMMERSFGFGDELLTEMGSGRRPLENLRRGDLILRRAVQKRLQAGLDAATEMLLSKRAALDSLASQLSQQLELTAEDVRKVCSLPPRLEDGAL